MKKVISCLAAASFLTVGFLWGKHHGSHIPQGVILDSGPGLELMDAVTQEFVDAWNQRDFEASSETYAEDAVFMFPGLPVMHGREAVQEFETESALVDPREMRIAEQVQEVIYFEDWAVMRGTGQFHVVNPEAPDEETAFKWAMLSKRNEAGNWESVWDILNFDE